MRTMRLAAIALLLLVASVTLWGCGGPAAPASDPVDLGPIPTALVEWDVEHMTIADRTNDARIIVVGTVTEVDSPRWNTPKGSRPGFGNQAPDLAVVYQTFYVQPDDTLKGEPHWGEPVAFRTVWWSSSTGSGRVSVGDEVVAFGYLSDSLYGGGTYRPAEAYWLLNEYAVWVREGDTKWYVNSGPMKDQKETRLTLEELEARIRRYASTTTLGMWDPARQSVKGRWGETVAADGILEVTVSAPERDPAARPVESAPDGVVDGLKASIGPALGSGTLEPGRSVTGTVPFQFSLGELDRVGTLRFDTYETRQTETPVVLIEWS